MKLNISTLLALSLMAPASLMADGPASIARPSSQNPIGQPTKNTFLLRSTLSIQGASKENAAQIVKAAKTAGATRARYNLRKGELKIAGKNLNVDRIIQVIQKDVPGVTAKKS